MSNAMINACDETLELRWQMETGWGRQRRYTYTPIHAHQYTHSCTLTLLYTLTHRTSGRRHLNNNNGIEKERYQTISQSAECMHRRHRQLALAYSVKSELIWSTVTTTTTTTTTEAAGPGRAGAQ